MKRPRFAVPIEMYLGGLDVLAAQCRAKPPRMMEDIAGLLRQFHADQIEAFGDILEAKSVTKLDEAKILSVLLGARLIHTYLRMRERLPADTPPDARAFMLSIIAATRAEFEVMAFDKSGKPGHSKH